MKLGSNILRASVVGMMMTQSACYDWEVIKPVELPKVSGSFAEPVADFGTSTVVAVRVVNVERPDGTLAQIRGRFDLRVVLVSGQELTFKNPVSVEREGDDLVIRGGNRAATRIPLLQIARAEASQYSQGKTALAITIPAVLFAGAAVAIGLAASPK